MGKIYFTLLFSLGKDFSTIYIKVFVQTGCRIFETWAEDEMVLNGCMLKQYRLNCSWTLHISCEHLYNSVYKFAFKPLEICKSGVYLQMEILPCLNTVIILWEYRNLSVLRCHPVWVILTGSALSNLWIGLV